MEPSELIAYYRNIAETTPGLALADLDVALTANPWPLQNRAALTSLRAEVKSVVDEATLLAWLSDPANGVPEWQWPGYYMENDEIKYDPRRLEPAPEPEVEQ